jgi:hypothetical protein
MQDAAPLEGPGRCLPRNAKLTLGRNTPRRYGFVIHGSGITPFPPRDYTLPDDDIQRDRQGSPVAAMKKSDCRNRAGR